MRSGQARGKRDCGAKVRYGYRAVLALALLLGALAAGCTADDPIYKIESQYSVADPQFQRSMGALLGPPIVDGNTTTTLVNGDRIFPPMLEAIRAARASITMETYIYWSGKTGQVFAQALSERARAGVLVHVLLDAVGSDRIDQDHIKQMRESGVNVVLFHALRWFDVGSAARMNNRTHRRLLVIDGKVGFTGGVGIADEWLGDARNDREWRDTHYRVEGPVVAQLQAAFMDHWIEVTGEVLHGTEYFPPMDPVGTQPAQLFKSSSRGGSESLRLMYLLSIAAARQSIRLETPYFVPDDQTIDGLLRARARGVAVQIIVPGPNIDLELVRKASRARWGRLLEAGVEIYEYQSTMFHCKLMVIDDLWSSIGSANLDNRSFELNSEANLNVLDGAFALEQAAIFEQDRARSHQVTYEMWKSRPLHEKLAENLASLLGPQL